MQKIICGHERHPKKPKVKVKGHDHDDDHDKEESEVHDAGSGDHHRSRRSADSMTESLAESFNFGKIF